MISLAVNTSFPQGQLCLFNDQTLLGDKTWEKQSSHSEVLTPHFQSLISECKVELTDINQIVCVSGPGSFTGIRVGVNFAKTMAYALDIPVVALNSLKLLASSCDDFSRPIFSAIDAQKNSVFLSKFNGPNLLTEFENKVVPIKELANHFNTPSTLCGEGLKKYSSFFDDSFWHHIHINESLQKPDLRNYFTKTELFKTMIAQDWYKLQPVYIKASAAEELRKKTSTTTPL